MDTSLDGEYEINKKSMEGSGQPWKWKPKAVRSRNYQLSVKSTNLKRKL